jgi:hypothetical protein
VQRPWTALGFTFKSGLHSKIVASSLGMGTQMAAKFPSISSYISCMKLLCDRPDSRQRKRITTA